MILPVDASLVSPNTTFAHPTLPDPNTTTTPAASNRPTSRFNPNGPANDVATPEVIIPKDQGTAGAILQDLGSFITGPKTPTVLPPSLPPGPIWEPPILLPPIITAPPAAPPVTTTSAPATSTSAPATTTSTPPAATTTTPAPGTPVGSIPDSSAFDRLASLLQSQFAGAGVSGGGSGYGGTVSAPFSDAAIPTDVPVAAPSSKRGLVIVALIVAAIAGVWYYKTHHKKAEK